VSQMFSGSGGFIRVGVLTHIRRRCAMEDSDKTMDEIGGVSEQEKAVERTIQSSGRVNLDESQLEYLGLEEGDEILVLSEDGMLKIVPNSAEYISV